MRANGVGTAVLGGIALFCIGSGEASSVDLDEGKAAVDYEASEGNYGDE